MIILQHITQDDYNKTETKKDKIQYFNTKIGEIMDNQNHVDKNPNGPCEKSNMLLRTMP